MSEEKQGVPWKWLAVTAVGILVALIGGVVSYFLSNNNSQVKELKEALKEQRAATKLLSERMHKAERGLAVMGVRVSAIRRQMRHSRHHRPAMMIKKKDVKP